MVILLKKSKKNPRLENLRSEYSQIWKLQNIFDKFNENFKYLFCVANVV